MRFKNSVVAFAALALLSLGICRPVFASQVPVLVELFTSEGCSDCPPADKLLTSFVRRQPIPGVEIIPLEEHIDYWNNPQHWVDPFSFPALTKRQYDYAALFNDDSPYTPEIVVNGRAHFVGSDSELAASTITAASQVPCAEISIVNDGTAKNGRKITLTVTHLPNRADGREIKLLVAVTQDELWSRVIGGENRGHTLYHSAVVRSLTSVGSVVTGENNVFQSTVPIPLGSSKAPEHVVAFLQDVRSLVVYGSAQIGI